MKRLLGILVCLALVVMLPLASAEGMIEFDGVEFHTDPITFTAWMDWPNPYDPWGTDYVSKWITDTTGVSFDYTNATNGTSEELNLLLISGEKLPDFIMVSGFSPVAKTLVREGYVEPLDVLAEEYFPAFMDLLPGQMFELYSEDDGHLYRTADWYADPVAVKELYDKLGKSVGPGNQTICLNKTYYEELGSPAIDTLDDLYNYLLLAHETYPEIALPFALDSYTWDNATDVVNFIYRMYGGEEWVVPQEDGTIQLCLRDEKYKSALAYLNKLYRAGILNKQSFTDVYGTDGFNAQMAECKTFAFEGQDWRWFSLVPDGDKEGSPVWPIEVPVAEGVDRANVKTKGGWAAIGGNTAVFISTDCKDKARAIEYLAFRYTLECSKAERFGLEGVTRITNEDGSVSWTDEYQNYVSEHGWSEMSRKYGCNNSVHSQFTTIYACSLESATGAYWVQTYNGTLNDKYAVNERLLDLTKIIKNDDIQMKYDQFVMHANESIVNCISAEDDASFEDAFEAYISGAETIGLTELEDYFTQNYKYWTDKGIQ